MAGLLCVDRIDQHLTKHELKTLNFTTDAVPHNTSSAGVAGLYMYMYMQINRSILWHVAAAFCSL